MWLYEDRTPEAIKAEIIKDLKSDEAHQKNGAWDTREGSFADDQSGPMAMQLSNVYASLNEIPYIIWVTEDSGPYIDMAANDLGIEPRKAGTKSIVELKVEAQEGYIIPGGKVFLTLDNLAFVVLNDTPVPNSGVVTANAEAQNVGAAYNVEADTITLQFDNASEITSVTNPEAAQGGTDPESDAALFARYDLARKKPRTSANKYHYQEWAVEVDGVEKAQVFPTRYGRGTVMVLIADGNRKPVNQAIIDACTAHIEGRMTCGGIELTVKTPSEVTINVSALLETDGTSTIEAIQRDFETALEGYFSDIALESTRVVYNYVGAMLIGISGVTNYSSLTLNGLIGDIALSDEQVPELGEVMVT